MQVLHITAHLGGGVGKAHAALRSAMPAHVRQTYVLLEPPRDRRYVDEIITCGGEIVIVQDIDEVAERCASADIVQFEFWNHPKLFECLADTQFPPMRSVFWSHVSGLFRPVIAPGFLTEADRFVFTTPASMALAEGLAPQQRSCLSNIGSGFGFPVLPPSALPGISPTRGENRRGAASTSIQEEYSECDLGWSQDDSYQLLSPRVGEMPGRAEGGIPPSKSPAKYPITYLGTVDLIKMHPGFFDAIDALSHDAEMPIWGGYDPAGEVAAKAAAMLHPQRIRFMGQTSDPQAALQKSRIFFYPLQPDHYGTAENALIEAMSLGLVPVVLANPAECAIIEHGVTGFVGQSIDDCVAILDRLLRTPDEVVKIGANAAAMVREKFTPERSAKAFVDLWSSLESEPKHAHDFMPITGRTPLDWYLATQGLAGEAVVMSNASSQQSKGTLAHFRSVFPDHPCWD